LPPILAQPHEIEFVAELGIVFLLFSLGLEFSMSGVPTTRIARRVSKERRNLYPLMQSFYAGYFKDSEGASTDRLEYLHVVALPQQAYAVLVLQDKPRRVERGEHDLLDGIE